MTTSNVEQLSRVEVGRSESWTDAKRHQYWLGLVDPVLPLLAAGLVALTIMGAVWKYRALMQGVGGAGSMAHAAASAPGASTFGFLRLPAVWLSFWFFFAWAAALGGVLTFGPEAARVLHEVPLSWVATCVTVYMLGSAGGMLVGGYLVADPSRADRVVAVSLSVATVFALLIGWTSAGATGAPTFSPTRLNMPRRNGRTMAPPRSIRLK